MNDDATEMDIIKSGKIKQSSRSMNHHQDNHRYFHNVINSKPNNHVKYSLLGDTITPSKTIILEEKEPNTSNDNNIEESHLVSYHHHHDHVPSSKGRFYSLSTTATANTTATESTFSEDGSNNNHPPRTATLFSCYINLCCTIIGAGMLGDTNI